MKVKSRSHLEKNDLAGFANLIITKFDFMTIFMFSRVRNPFLTLLLSYHVSVTSKIQVNFRYRRYLKVLMIVSYGFWNFFTIYVFEGEESISDIPIELPCFGDLENPGKLPVQEVLEGTDDCVLWIFEILHYLCFRGWGIHFRYSYWATMFWWPRKSRSTSGTGGTRRYWWLCLMNFWYFFNIYVFEIKKSISDIPTELPCSGDLENPGQLPVQEVLMILSYEFSKFLQYLCFQGQGIHCWHSYWATLFGLSWKSRSTSGTEVLEGTDDCVLWIFDISSLFMFSRSSNRILTFLQSYHVWVTSKIQVNFRFRRYWWFCLMDFWNFSTIYVFEVNESIADIPTELPCLGDLKNL